MCKTMQSDENLLVAPVALRNCLAQLKGGGDSGKVTSTSVVMAGYGWFGIRLVAIPVRCTISEGDDVDHDQHRSAHDRSSEQQKQGRAPCLNTDQQ
jgi:hypothetical protein